MKKLQPEYTCAIDLVIDIIGGKWKVLLLWNLNEGTKRFNELQRSVPGIARKMLAQQLRELEEHGLVERTVYDEVPPRVEYTTTDLGRGLQPALYAMCRWGDEYAEGHGIQMNRCWTQTDFIKEQN